MDISNKIRLLRVLKGDDQRDLAISLGMKSPTHINRWERNISMPRTDMLKRLGSVLNVYWPWLADSNSRFADGQYVKYYPLSPFGTYTPRWLALLPLDLEKLLPEFFKEIAFNKFWFFEAHCGGGIAVAAKMNFTIVIICHPHISNSVRSSMPSPQIENMSDFTYANNFFLNQGINEILDRCGIEHDEKSDQTRSMNQISDTIIEVNLKAKLPDVVDHQMTKDMIQKSINEIIKECCLSDTELEINITAPQNSYDFLLGQIEDVKLKELALKLLREDDFS